MILAKLELGGLQGQVRELSMETINDVELDLV